MALIKCPECGREKVSDTAEMCPDCGYGIKAHFERLHLEEESEKKKELQEKIRIEAEKAKQRADAEAKRVNNERVKGIPKPNKPKISLLGLLIGGIICLIGSCQLRTDDLDREYSISHGNGDPIFYGWFFLIVGIAVLCFVIYIFLKQKERYNLAETDFSAYQNMVMKERIEQAENMKRQAEAERIRRENAPKCPMCNSINIEKISTTSRAISVATVGLASGKIGKQYKCKNCKHMW